MCGVANRVGVTFCFALCLNSKSTACTILFFARDFPNVLRVLFLQKPLQYVRGLTLAGHIRKLGHFPSMLLDLVKKL